MNLFKVNQRVWSFTKGWGTVTEITNSSTTGYDYPVKVTFDRKGDTDCFTDEGCARIGENRSLFFEEFYAPEQAIVPKRWRANKWGKYWYLNNLFEPLEENDSYGQFDTKRYNIGNYFETEELAIEYSNKCIKVLTDRS